MRVERLILTLALVSTVGSAATNEFDLLREKWREMLTLGTNFNSADPNYSTWLIETATLAQNYWNAMNTNSNRVSLWNDLTGIVTNSAEIRTTYIRLRTMALAHSLHGSALETDPMLFAAITDGLDWMHSHYYHQTNVFYDNWFDWEIGVPLNLNDITVLLYDRLSEAQISNYVAAVYRFTPAPAYTSANKVWKAAVVALRGVLAQTSTNLSAARDALSDVFPYVTSGEGFYMDGSYNFHDNFPYTGHYGAELIKTMAPLLELLRDSSWEVTDPLQTNLFRWIHDSFEPVIYDGAMMQMVSGRAYSRTGDDHVDGHDAISSILRIAQFAPPADAAAYKSMVKYWLQADSFRDFVSTRPPPYNIWAKEILADATIIPRGPLVGHYPFARVDRIVHLRPNWGLGLAMSSKRIANFESFRGENLRGWYMADGMTYLYTSDHGQYADGFWATVNAYRLPGTTVDTQVRAISSGREYLSSNTWVGGACITGSSLLAAAAQFGVAGMHLRAWNSPLTAHKSWFMFDDEVVCLGAGITATNNRTIETIVENRRLGSVGSNSFVVNGIVKPSANGWSERMPNVLWAHLAGNVPGSELGYYFPQPETVNALRETRTGALSDINTKFGSTNLHTCHYLNLWLDHGRNPTNAAYTYVLLPGQSSGAVAAYAARPHVTVLENTSRAQAVSETNLNITAVNFWQDASNRLGKIVTDRKSSVMVRDDGSWLEIGISDPTQTNTAINLEYDAPALRAVTLDTGITLNQLHPTIKMRVNASQAGGRTFRARFLTKATLGISASSNAITLRWPSGSGLELYTTTNLAPPVVWNAVDVSSAFHDPTNATWNLAFPLQINGARFFRLQTP